jgi:hypothetical protein
MCILGAITSPVSAASLLVIPSFVTNFWQLFTGPDFLALELGRFAQCPRRILSIVSRMVLEHRRCAGAGIGDRDGLGIGAAVLAAVSNAPSV